MADERFTEFHVLYDMSDITALEDSTPTTEYNKSFCDISYLKDPIDKFPGNMTLEHNYSVLDGSKREFQDYPPYMPFFSNEMSDENGEFDDNPIIDITFTQYHSSYGLTISFIDDYPLQVRCTWYQDEEVIFSDIFDVEDKEFILHKDVPSYNHLEIEFVKTLPYRYVKINYIRYGVMMHWDENQIKTGNLNLEMDLISHQLSINTLDFDFVDPDETTNPGNTHGLHNYFQRNQIMYPYEIINGEKVELGEYFLDSFSYEKNICKINAVSRIGLFDTIQFAGDIYNGESASDVLEDIFNTAGLYTLAGDYFVDEVTAAQLLYGALPPMSCRKALEAVLFACQSIVNTTLSGGILVCKPTKSISESIQRGVKLNTKVTKTDYVSGIEIKYNNYELDSNSSQVIKETYEEGIYTVILSNAYTYYSISNNATLLVAKPFYLKFQVNTAGETIITGRQYKATNNCIRVERPYVEAGEGQNIKSFNTTLCNASTAKQLAEKLLDYYDDRLEIEIKHLSNSIDMNSRNIIENPTLKMDNYIGRLTSRNIDLTGGFIDNTKFVGRFDKSSYNYYVLDVDDMDEVEILPASYNGTEFVDEVI